MFTEASRTATAGIAGAAGAVWIDADSVPGSERLYALPHFGDLSGKFVTKQDVKVVPHRCITDPELRLFQYTAIDELTRLRVLAAYPEQSTYSSADFLEKLVK